MLLIDRRSLDRASTAPPKRSPWWHLFSWRLYGALDRDEAWADLRVRPFLRMADRKRSRGRSRGRRRR